MTTHKNPNSDHFKFCPQCGSSKFKTDSRKSFNCRQCSFTFFMNCAAAVIGIIEAPDKKLIVTKRKFDPYKGMLDFPGGFADPGESIEDALKREIKEELNLDINKLDYLGSLPNIYQYKNIMYDITDIVFKCQVATLETIKAADDISSFSYIAPKDLNADEFGLSSAKLVVGWIKNGRL